MFFENIVFAGKKFDTRIHLIQLCKAGFMKLRIYIVTYKLKHSTYKTIVQGREGVGFCFDAMIIIILMSINYSISMSYSIEIQHFSCNICQ